MKQVWRNNYKDYKPDEAWIKEQVEPGRGIVGCEMHEHYGWGISTHRPKQKKAGLLSTILNLLFKKT
ncbi:MAG: hypothetical protein JJU12_00695 [Chlamydiales bacterium]|nr:hypothetical protein [Chlamydiales bacterium]